ncbi:MAG: hypothetical protein GY944_29650 [bacterium]|nr:hypothetical protein [bacterium]
MSAVERIQTAVDSLARARKRLDERNDHEIVQCIGQVRERFRDPTSSCRRELEAKLPAATGFAQQTVRAGLDRGFEPWTAEALERLVADELGSLSTSLSITGYERTSVLLAGSIPMPSVLSILLPLVVRSPVLCKPASRDPITPGLLIDTLREVDALLADCVAVVPFDASDQAANQAFYASPCISATGSDETIATVERFLASGQQRVLYGHRVSVSVVDLAASTPDDVEALAIDIALWDQLGCLSPVLFHLVGGPEGSADAFAEALAEQLATLERRWPRGQIEPEAAAAIATERADAQMRAALDQGTRTIASPGTQWTVVLERDSLPRPAPLHRFIRLVSLPDRDALREALAPVSPHLAGVSLVGFASDRENLVEELFAFGASRVCAAGRLQAPPLGWRRDNQPLLLGMTRLGNHELK